MRFTGLKYSKLYKVYLSSVQQFFSFLSLDFFILTAYFTRKNGKDRLLRFARPELAAVFCPAPDNPTKTTYSKNHLLWITTKMTLP